MSKRLRNGRNDGFDRYVQLPHYLLKTAAWKSLDAVARSLYVELKYRFNGSNNGSIGYGIRQAATDLHVGKSTAARAFRSLTKRGFIIAAKEGKFARKSRHSSEWLLTEYPSNIDIEHPDRKLSIRPLDLARKDFTRWPRAANGSQQTVSVVGPTGPLVGPTGPYNGTVPFRKTAHGI